MSATILAFPKKLRVRSLVRAVPSTRLPGMKEVQAFEDGCWRAKSVCSPADADAAVKRLTEKLAEALLCDGGAR